MRFDNVYVTSLVYNKMLSKNNIMKVRFKTVACKCVRMEVRPICNAHTSSSTKSSSQQTAVAVLVESLGLVYCE